MLRNNELNDFSVAELLHLHVGISEQLRTRGIVRGENVPTGELAEFLFRRSYEWTQANNSEKAFDARDGKGKHYQIKGRRMHHRTSSRQLSAIRDLQGFDILAAVLFDHEYRVSRTALIPNKVKSSFVGVGRSRREAACRSDRRESSKASRFPTAHTTKGISCVNREFPE